MINIDWLLQSHGSVGCFHWFITPTFTIFDINSPIKESLLKNTINFAEQHTEISEKDKAIIFHGRKSLLFNGQHVWIKKEGGLFDVTMGAFDGAEACEVVGNFLLYQL